MIATTTSTIPGYEITEIIGDVTSVQFYPYHPRSGADDFLNAQRGVINNLKDAARKGGGDAVIGMKIQVTCMPNPAPLGMYLVINGIGMAVKLVDPKQIAAEQKAKEEAEQKMEEKRKRLHETFNEAVENGTVSSEWLAMLSRIRSCEKIKEAYDLWQEGKGLFQNEPWFAAVDKKIIREWSFVRTYGERVNPKQSLKSGDTRVSMLADALVALSNNMDKY